jgi:hypothetical protein
MISFASVLYIVKSKAEHTNIQTITQTIFLRISPHPGSFAILMLIDDGDWYVPSIGQDPSRFNALFVIGITLICEQILLQQNKNPRNTGGQDGNEVQKTFLLGEVEPWWGKSLCEG